MLVEETFSHPKTNFLTWPHSSPSLDTHKSSSASLNISTKVKPRQTQATEQGFGLVTATAVCRSHFKPKPLKEDSDELQQHKFVD